MPGGTAFQSPRGKSLSTLHPDVCQTANRGLEIFPVPEFAMFSGHADLLIGEATSDLVRLKELAEEYRSSTWRVAVGASGLCVVEAAGPEGKASLAATSQGQVDCLTLRVERGGMAWAFFQWPKGLVLRDPAKRLPPGVRILGDGDSCPVPPSPSCRWTNPWAEIETLPVWLRELAFNTPDSPPGRAVSAPERSPRPAPCRSSARFEMQHRRSGIGFPIPDHAGWRGGFRVSRRR
ncbi:MAG: bifunctional DNA primase/polymerase [Acidobacteriota bacterium]